MGGLNKLSLYSGVLLFGEEHSRQLDSAKRFQHGDIGRILEISKQVDRQAF